MIVTELVMMAADSGELDTVTDVDVMLFELSKYARKDTTWQEVVDALLEVRQNLQAKGTERVPEPALRSPD